jgi:hypothetical protein
MYMTSIVLVVRVSGRPVNDGMTNSKIVLLERKGLKTRSRRKTRNMEKRKNTDYSTVNRDGRLKFEMG